ncbi:MAG TPA: EamA family transporter [Phnomibacter sp.]|nr:EamA family transporter [Phnomibacter sp.]
MISLKLKGPNSNWWLGVSLVLLSAFLFAGKAVLAKLVYKLAPVSVSEILVLRMAFSLPFYGGMLFWQLQKFKQQTSYGLAARKQFLPAKWALPALGLGCLGYYVSSYLDFWGLQYISAGLERIILFSYPTWVVVFGWLVFRQKMVMRQGLALLLTYAGIAISYLADVSEQGNPYVLKGSMLIIGCAITFAWFVLLSGKVIPQLGPGLFNAVGMLGATAMVFLHYGLLEPSGQNLWQWPAKVYLLMGVMALFCTVVPTLLVAVGIQKIGSSNVAIISSIGPVITIVQARYLLGEPFGWLQAFGTLLVVSGVWWVSKSPAEKQAT